MSHHKVSPASSVISRHPWLTDQECRKAATAVHRFAVDGDDEQLLLEMLGIDDLPDRVQSKP